MKLDEIVVEHRMLGNGRIKRIDSKGIWVVFSSKETCFSLENLLGKHLFIRDKENEEFVESVIKTNIEKEDRKVRRRQSDPDSFLAEYARKIEAIEKREKKEEEARKHEDIQKERQKIKQIIIDRQIKHLVHFTRLENLTSILKHGLVPVSLQEQRGIRSVKNDKERREGRKDCTSCSVEFPNYQMFYSYRMNNPEFTWVVLIIDANILLVDFRDIYFSYTNAARAHQKTNRRFHWFRSPEEFEAMFSQPCMLYTQNNFSREQQSISDNMPTDPQAEILISDIIDPQYINRVCFNDKDDLSSYLSRKEIIDEGTNKFCCDPTLFNYRKDYEFWKKENSNGT